MLFEQKYSGRTISVIFSMWAIIAFMISAPSVQAAAGRLDNSLDGNGKLATDFGGFDVVTDTLVLPDGKIIVVGINGGGAVFGPAAVARYNVDGSLDTTFSGDGKLLLSCQCVNAVVTKHPDNTSIYVAYAELIPTVGSTLLVTKIFSGGIVDPDFAGDGRAEQSTTENFVLGDIAIQSDFKIVVVGGTTGNIPGGTTPPSDWLLWRFHSNGALDTGFSGDGRQQTDFGGNLSEYASSVEILANGIILVGGTGNPAGQVFALARYTTNGSLDTNWGGGDGKIVTDVSTGADIPSDMQIDSGGRILLSGSSRPGGVQTGTIVRYGADGVIDNSFDGDGILQTASFGPVIEEIAIQFTDEKIIGVGGTTDFIVGRLNVNGTPDMSFGNGGFVVTDMNNNSDDEPRAVAIAFDRRIVVVGSTLNTAAGSTRNFCVARYLPTNVSYRAPFDFDGDNKSDYGIFRPTNGQWWINQSSTTTSFGSSVTNVYGFGSSTDRLAPADFTGDGKTDIALFRPSTGQWFILRSENSSFYAFPFGTTGDIPVPGDYDADGEADAAVFRPSNSTWFISQSSGAPTRIEQFGINGDQPVVADYDEDGKADVGIFRPGPGEWWIQRSTAGLLALQFGANGDKPVQGDYTGDGKADIGIFRPTNGQWLILRSDDFSFYGFPFGAANDVPAPADYDGDGRIDPTVVRGTQWFIGRSSSTTQIFGFGAAGDRPIPNAFVP